MQPPHGTTSAAVTTKKDKSLDPFRAKKSIHKNERNKTMDALVAMKTKVSLDLQKKKKTITAFPPPIGVTHKIVSTLSHWRGPTVLRDIQVRKR